MTAERRLPPVVRYPFASLAAAMCTTEARAARELGLSGSTEQQYRRDGVSARVADRLAVKAGVHPYEVWPEMVDHVIAAMTVECEAGDCTNRFVPPVTASGQKRKRYCSRACQLRWNHKRRYQSDPAARERQKAAARRYKAEVRESRRMREAA